MSSDQYDAYKGSISVPSSFERIIGYTVHDSAEQAVGKVQNLWIDEGAQPLFLGVKTGWLFGKNHVVPIGRADVNDSRQTVRLPFTEDQIKNAPTFDEDADIGESDQENIFLHYGVGPAGTTKPVIQNENESLDRQDIPPSVESEKMEAPISSDYTKDRTIQLKEEQLKVGKRDVDAGGIRLRKIVRTEVVNQPVELQHEEIVIERVPGNSPVANENFGGEDIFIPLRREEAVVEKGARVTEEVRVGKKVEVDQQQVSAEVRKEELQVDDSKRVRPKV